MNDYTKPYYGFVKSDHSMIRYDAWIEREWGPAQVRTTIPWFAPPIILPITFMPEKASTKGEHKMLAGRRGAVGKRGAGDASVWVRMGGGVRSPLPARLFG